MINGFVWCPISPYIFLFVEVMALSICQNDQILSIPTEDQEVKISLFAKDLVFFTWIR